MAAGTGRAAFAVLVFRSAALLGWMRPCAAQSEVVGPPAPLVAPLGGEVVLPCSLQPAVDVYGLTVEWARPDLRPKYVSVWSNGEFMQAYENPAFSGRKSLFTEELRRGNISLKLSDLRPSDQGSYRCYVPNLDGLAIVDLLVVDPGSSRTAVWLAVLPVVGVLAAVTALWVLWRRTRLKRKKQQDAEAGGEESRGRPLLEGGDQQDEDRSKANSSQVQLHTVTPAAEHLDPQKPAAEHLDPQTPAGEHLDLQTLRDVRQKPDAEETHEEETETAGQDGNREEQRHPEQKGENKRGDLKTGAKIKKLFQRNSGKKADEGTEDQSLKEEGKHGEKEEKKKQSLEQKIQQKQRCEKRWRRRVSMSEKQIEDRENEMKELDQQLKEVKIQLKNTEEDLKKTEEQTETPQEEKEKAVKALSDRREELQKKKEEVQKTLEKRDKDIEIMKKELGVMTGRKNKATAEKTELMRELEKLREAEASSSQTEEQRKLSTHNASGQQEAAD
ncbi:uncharacterized protein ACNS7B_021223 [Menidia menidia]